MKIQYIDHENEINEKWKPVVDQPNEVVVVDGKTYTVITRQITEQGSSVSEVIKKMVELKQKKADSQLPDPKNCCKG